MFREIGNKGINISSIEELRKKERTINEKFIAKTLNATSLLGDDVKIYDLRLTTKYLKERGINRNENPPKEWKGFYDNLTAPEKSALSSALSSAIVSNFETVGSIRKATVKDLLKAKRNPALKRGTCIGPIKALLLKGIFPSPNT